MRFFLGTHQPDWLAHAGVPLFVSHRRLARYRRLPVAVTDWALDSGGFTELSLYGRWVTTPARYAAAVRRYRDEIGHLAWCAPQDWMCEPQIVARTGRSVPAHQRATVAGPGRRAGRRGEGRRMTAPGQVIVIRGDARQLPLPDASADLIVTSPPYWALRAWTDDGSRYRGQIGTEDTPRQWLDALMACTREWARVLKSAGSLFVNLGDKYDSGTAAPRVNPGTVNDGTGQGWHQAGLRASAGRRKSLLGLPWRYALACTDQAGLLLRAEIVWNRPNPLPEAVTDRVRYTHQQVFHLVKQASYYAAVDEIREPHTGGTHPRRTDGRLSPKEAATVAAGHRRGFFPQDLSHPLGKVPGSVWEIPAQPLIIPGHVAHARCCGGRKRDGCQQGLAHFAAFPPALAHPIIAGWSPPGICAACGQGRRPVTIRHRRTYYGAGRWRSGARQLRDGAAERGWKADEKWHAQVAIAGYACACPAPDAPVRPAVVVDPFGGTGTTALVASVLGRTGITIDRSGDYCRLAAWRTSDPRERARVPGQWAHEPAPQRAAA